MAITQVSNSSNLFAQNGTRVIRDGESTASGSGAAQTDKEKAEELQQQFLGILLTQLQNQNPLDPVDSTEYTNQLVQYSSLEQQIDTNLKLGNIIDSLQVSSSFSAFSYIGNDVEIATNQTAMQDGNADWTYSLNKGTDKAEVIIRNGSGQLVYKENLGAQNPGAYNFSLDSAETRIPVADGEVLYMSVVALDGAGAEIDADIITNITVDSVETGSNGAITLRAGDLFFGVDDISKISRTNGGSTSA